MSMRQHSYLMTGIKVDRSIIDKVFDDDAFYELQDKSWSGEIPLTIETGENTDSYFIGKVIASLHDDNDEDCVELDPDLYKIEEVKESMKKYFPEFVDYEVKFMLVSLWS